ncbi:hypothetical protein Ancab_007601 [Ancistrocladus abbreviatus]
MYSGKLLPTNLNSLILFKTKHKLFDASYTVGLLLKGRSTGIFRISLQKVKSYIFSHSFPTAEEKEMCLS